MLPPDRKRQHLSKLFEKKLHQKLLLFSIFYRNYLFKQVLNGNFRTVFFCNKFYKIIQILLKTRFYHRFMFIYYFKSS